MPVDYLRFRRLATGACIRAPCLDALTQALRTDVALVNARNRARQEMQLLFDRIRAAFDMPPVPVYLPIRKKIGVLGQAHILGGSPHEIRIYPVHGPREKPYRDWEPRDIRIDSDACVLDTLIHESAHLLEAHRFGILSHEEHFVAAYCQIEDFLVESKLVAAVDPSERLAGCPADSYAARYRTWWTLVRQ